MTSAQDPLTIEQTTRQIKSIEKLSADVKRAIRNSNKQASGAPRNFESAENSGVGSISQSSCKSRGASATGERSSTEPDFKVPSVPGSAGVETVTKSELIESESQFPLS